MEKKEWKQFGLMTLTAFFFGALTVNLARIVINMHNAGMYINWIATSSLVVLLLLSMTVILRQILKAPVSA